MTINKFLGYVIIFLIGFGACALIVNMTNKTPRLNEKTATANEVGASLVGGNEVQQAAEKISKYVVNIDTVGIVQDNQSYFSMPQEQQGRASGVIISEDGYILTNNHVVENANQVKVTLYNDKQYDANIIGTDPRTDMAVIKIKEKGLPVAKFADSNNVKVGEYVIAVGNALGLGPTVTTGVISAKREQFDLNGKAFDSIIQTDASINQGNSGGALSDLNGNLIGINTAIASPSGGSVGIGFAVPSNTARKIAEELIKNGSVERAWLGIGMVAYDENYRKNLEAQGVPSLPTKDGIMVGELYNNSPALKAGIKKGDIITSIDGIDLSKMKKDNQAVAKLSTTIANKKVGDKVTLGVISGGENKTVTVTLGKLDEKKLKQQAEQFAPRQREMDPGEQGMPFPFPFFGRGE